MDRRNATSARPLDADNFSQSRADRRLAADSLISRPSARRRMFLPAQLALSAVAPPTELIELVRSSPLIVVRAGAKHAGARFVTRRNFRVLADFFPPPRCLRRQNVLNARSGGFAVARIRLAHDFSPRDARRVRARAKRCRPSTAHSPWPDPVMESTVQMPLVVISRVRGHPPPLRHGIVKSTIIFIALDLRHE